VINIHNFTLYLLYMGSIGLRSIIFCLMSLRYSSQIFLYNILLLAYFYFIDNYSSVQRRPTLPCIVEEDLVLEDLDQLDENEGNVKKCILWKQLLLK